MVSSREWTEWHLTPDGWIRGFQKTDFGSIEKETPIDRVLSCKYEEEMLTALSPIDEDFFEYWRIDNSQLIDKLIKKYGTCPKHL